MDNVISLLTVFVSHIDCMLLFSGVICTVVTVGLDNKNTKKTNKYLFPTKLSASAFCSNDLRSFRHDNFTLKTNKHNLDAKSGDLN